MQEQLQVAHGQRRGLRVQQILIVTLDSYLLLLLLQNHHFQKHYFSATISISAMQCLPCSYDQLGGMSLLPSDVSGFSQGLQGPIHGQ